jgi:hypothetical protein
MSPISRRHRRMAGFAHDDCHDTGMLTVDPFFHFTNRRVARCAGYAARFSAGCVPRLTGAADRSRARLLG